MGSTISGVRSMVIGQRMALRLWDLLCHAVFFFRWFLEALELLEGASV